MARPAARGWGEGVSVANYLNDAADELARLRADVEALVGCVAGAVLVDETRAQAEAAGLSDIVLYSKPEYIDAMTNWEDPLYRKIVAALPPESKPSDYITSLDVTATRRG